MKSSSTLLQQAYFTALSGQVNVNVVIPVYDTVPSSPSYPYIQLDDQTKTDYVTKSSFGEEVTQQLWIVDRFSDSFGSRINLNAILDRVQQIIRARPVPLTLAGFNVISSTLDIAVFSRDRTDTHTYFRYEVRFRHLIEEL